MLEDRQHHPAERGKGSCIKAKRVKPAQPPSCEVLLLGHGSVGCPVAHLPGSPFPSWRAHGLGLWDMEEHFQRRSRDVKWAS